MITFSIWHKDRSLVSTPEFTGSMSETAKKWFDSYQYNTGSLDYEIEDSNGNLCVACDPETIELDTG